METPGVTHEQDEAGPPLFLSVVVPCRNEEAGLAAMHRRVRAVCDGTGRRCEIVLVNDGSADGTWGAMLGLAGRDPDLVLVDLSRNFGQERALSAGLTVCRGERILILDADLQDPPELLPDMLALMRGGAEVVYGRRRSRAGESAFKRLSAAAYYRVLEWASEVPIPRDTGHFRLMSRRVLDVLLAMPERRRYTGGLVSWIGFRQVPLDYDRAPRETGRSQWPLRAMLGLALDGPRRILDEALRLTLAFAAVSAAVACVAAVQCLRQLAAVGSADAGGVLVICCATFSAFQLVSLGVLGEYAGRLVEQARGRPLFVIAQVVRPPSAGVRASADLTSAAGRNGHALVRLAPR